MKYIRDLTDLDFLSTIEFEASISIPRPTSDYQNYFNSSSSSEEL